MYHLTSLNAICEPEIDSWNSHTEQLANFKIDCRKDIIWKMKLFYILKYICKLMLTTNRVLLKVGKLIQRNANAKPIPYFKINYR